MAPALGLLAPLISRWICVKYSSWAQRASFIEERTTAAPTPRNECECLLCLTSAFDITPGQESRQTLYPEQPRKRPVRTKPPQRPDAALQPRVLIAPPPSRPHFRRATQAGYHAHARSGSRSPRNARRVSSSGGRTRPERRPFSFSRPWLPPTPLRARLGGKRGDWVACAG